MKKIVCLIIVGLMVAFTPAYAIISISPSFSWAPSGMPTLGKIRFAESICEYFLGIDYQIVDNFIVDVEYRYGCVRLKYEEPHYDYDYLIIVFNNSRHYYLTPIIVNNYMLCDFTNIEPDLYEVYVVQSVINGEM